MAETKWVTVTRRDECKAADRNPGPFFFDAPFTVCFLFFHSQWMFESSLMPCSHTGTHTLRTRQETTYCELNLKNILAPPNATQSLKRH